MTGSKHKRNRQQPGSERIWKRFILMISIVLCSILIFSYYKSTEAEAQWRFRQRIHRLSSLSDAQSLSLCQKTDIDQIRQRLHPILTTRIVASSNHRTVGEYLKSNVENLGFSTEWDEFSTRTPIGSRQFRNLIAISDPNAPRRLTLACHYDSKIFKDFNFIGATDSALPCALLLDIASTIGPLLHKKKHKDLALQLLFLDGEEAFVEWTTTDSIYGARHLASKLYNQFYSTSDGFSTFSVNRQIERIDVFVLLDLLGAANPTITNFNGLGAQELFAVLPKIESELRRLRCLRPIPQIFHDRRTFASVQDDHIPFFQRGVPILHLISAPFPSVWHTINDNESALDNDTIMNLASILRVFIAQYLGIEA